MTDYTLDLTPDLEAKIFPDFTESRFTVSKEEKSDLWDKTKEEFGPMSPLPIPFVQSKSEKEYSKRMITLEEQKLDNKINHISSVLGEPIENVGLNNKQDMALVFDLARSKYYQTRQKKFLDYYPEGSYQEIQVNVGGNQTDTIEIFKYDKSQEGWKIANPYGRDFGEIAKVAGHLFTAPLIGDVAAVLTKKVKSLTAIPMTARVAIGNWLGIKGDKAIEHARKYGEDEFDADGYSDINWTKFATDVSDWGGAALAGGFYKGADFITQYMTKGKKPGLVDLGPDMVKAANELGIEPLVYAQIVANPIIRRLFNTAGEFVTIPETVRGTQADALLASLKKYGISEQTQTQIAKNIAEGVPDKDILNLQQIIDLEDSLKIKLGDAMKTFNNDFVDTASTKTNLDEVLDDLNVTMNSKKTFLTNKVFGKGKVGFKTGISNIDGAYVNLREFRTALSKELKNFKNNTIKYSDETTMDEVGTVVTKTLKEKKPYRDLPKEFKPILKSINDMLAIPKSKKGELGFDIGTLTQIKDKNMDGLRTLFQIREDLFDLTLNSNKPEVIAAAKTLHSKLTGVLDNDIGGSNAFKSSMKALNAQTTDMENVKHLSFMKDALGKSGDPDAFIQKFMQPGGPIKLEQLKGMLMHGALSDKEKAAGEAAFNLLSKKWYSNIFRNADDATLNKWVTDDPDGLKLLLGDRWKPKVKQMREIIDLTKRVQGGVTAKLQLGTNKEFAESIIAKSNLKGEPALGLDREFNVILQDLGGINGSGSEMLRMNIIKKMLDDSMMEVTKGKGLGTMRLSPKILKEKIRELGENSNLMKFFNEEQMKALSNYNLYTTALSGGSDVGAILAAGAEAQKLTDGMFSPQIWLQTGFTIFKHDLVAQILARKQTTGLFNKLDLENVLSETNLDLINVTLAELTKDIGGSLTGVNSKGKGVGGEIDADLISNLTNSKNITDTSLRNTGTGSGSMMLPTDNIKTSFNTDRPISQSSVANANMFGPVNPDTMTKGKQLFKDDITFAAQGGIMNTKTAFQRVA